jgi:transposase
MGMLSNLSLKQRMPQTHSLRAIRKLTDGVLRSLNSDFDASYAETGWPSIAQEYLLRALLLQVFYSIAPGARSKAGGRSTVIVLHFYRQTRESRSQSIVFI